MENEVPEHLKLFSSYLACVDFEYRKIKDDSTASLFYAEYWHFRQWFKNEIKGIEHFFNTPKISEDNHFIVWSNLLLKIDGKSLREMQDSENYEPKIRGGKITMVKNG